MTTGAASQRAASRRAAWFVIDAAIEAGFALRAAGGGRLEVLPPAELKSEICEPILAALEEHRQEIVQTLLFFDACGIPWTPIEQGRAQ